jgi:acyl dehydratase
MATGLWLDDLHVGHRFRTDVYDLTADDIIEFATKWDPQPFHLSDETAQDTFFHGLAGSGWHTAAITMRLLVTSGIALARGIIGAGGEVAWPTATRPGDRLHVEGEVVDVHTVAARGAPPADCAQLSRLINRTPVSLREFVRANRAVL